MAIRDLRSWIHTFLHSAFAEKKSKNVEGRLQLALMRVLLSQDATTYCDVVEKLLKKKKGEVEKLNDKIINLFNTLKYRNSAKCNVDRLGLFGSMPEFDERLARYAKSTSETFNENRKFDQIGFLEEGGRGPKGDLSRFSDYWEVCLGLFDELETNKYTYRRMLFGSTYTTPYYFAVVNGLTKMAKR